MIDDSPSPMLLEEGTVVAERYRVIRCLRLGGMGGVYRVLDMQNDRFRALKAMLPDASEDADLRRRFEQEAVIAGRIRSDHVVAVTDSGIIQPDGTRFIVMELLDGSDLGATLKNGGPLEHDEVVQLLHQVALGLDRIHAEGIVHRDLKPENIFVGQRDDGSPWVKILDFGIAKNVGGLATLATTRALGTPLYMAPEQLTGDATIDFRADLYSFAHVAFTLLVGRPYWHPEAERAPSAFAFCNRVLEGMGDSASERARQHDVALPIAFDRWFERATATQAEDRFASAISQNRALLDAFSADVIAVPDRRPRHVWGSLGVIVVVAGAAFLVVSSESEPSANQPSVTQSELIRASHHADVATSSASASAVAKPAPPAPVIAIPKPRPSATPTAPPARPSRSHDPLDHL